MTKSYERHYYLSFEDIENDTIKNPDRKYVIGALLNVVQYCKENRIHFFGHFTEIFKSIGFKSKDISNLLINSIKSSPQQKLEWVSNRTISKANLNELNIILTKFIHQNKDKFESYIKANIHDRNQIEIQMIINEINNEMDEIKKRSEDFLLLNNDDSVDDNNERVDNTNDSADDTIISDFDLDIYDSTIEDFYFCEQ